MRRPFPPGALRDFFAVCVAVPACAFVNRSALGLPAFLCISIRHSEKVILTAGVTEWAALS